jgi:hypothetical protein
MTDMRHMEYLEIVTANDVACIREKEATYQGSWKKSGGLSAWHNVKRKIDRLLVMMARPDDPPGWDGPDELVCGLQNMVRDDGHSRRDFSRLLRDAEHLGRCHTAENIFAKIREAPGGEDGTVLAEVRDLRRYLLLVEAEMMARSHIYTRESTIQERPDVDGTQHARQERLEDGVPDHPTSSYYITMCHDATNTNHWLVDRNSVDPELWDHLPRLRLELNRKEWSELPPYYQPLYEWLEIESKYKLKTVFVKNWGKS